MNDITKIHLSLEFGGTLLPIGHDEKGQDVVPLKPIADLIGLEWKRQLKRVSDGYLARRLGTCGVHMYSAGQGREVVCIRLDRVASFLNSVNPESIRAAGNVQAADFLERKHQEWDDVLHAYEQQEGMLATHEQREAGLRSRRVRDFLAVSREKRSSADEADRKVLGHLMQGMASDLGVPYQEELEDLGPVNQTH